MILKWHQAGYVFPAHAGMIPGANIRGAHAHRVPRTRGDDPAVLAIEIELHFVFPAHAGMIPGREDRRRYLAGVPRTRGDDPCATFKTPCMTSCSPHTRG